MEADMSPEMASQVLSMLTGGGSMDHINTSLALRLIPPRVEDSNLQSARARQKGGQDG